MRSVPPRAKAPNSNSRSDSYLRKSYCRFAIAQGKAFPVRWRDQHGHVVTTDGRTIIDADALAAITGKSPVTVRRFWMSQISKPEIAGMEVAHV